MSRNARIDHHTRFKSGAYINNHLTARTDFGEYLQAEVIWRIFVHARVRRQELAKAEARPQEPEAQS